MYNRVYVLGLGGLGFRGLLSVSIAVCNTLSQLTTNPRTLEPYTLKKNPSPYNKGN